MVKIDKSYNMTQIHLFKNPSSTYILGEKTLPKLKKAIRENVKMPSKDIKVFLIKFKLNLDDKNQCPLRISFAPYFITEKLKLISDQDNQALTIEYSKDEFEKYGFEKEHIKKIIKAIKNNKVSYKELSDNITNILK